MWLKVGLYTFRMDDFRCCFVELPVRMQNNPNTKMLCAIEAVALQKCE